MQNKKREEQNRADCMLRVFANAKTLANDTINVTSNYEIFYIAFERNRCKTEDIRIAQSSAHQYSESITKDLILPAQISKILRMSPASEETKIGEQRTHVYLPKLCLNRSNPHKAETNNEKLRIPEILGP